jgi:hypothetical protein
MTDNTPPNPPAPVRARPWKRDGAPPAPRSSSSYRFVFRLLSIPVIAVAAVILYRGLRAHLVLPACDSGTAKQTLAQVLKELKLEPTRYAPITTVSSSKDKVVCNAVLPLPGGGSVVADYTFYWQGNTASMRYSIHRQTAKSSSLDAPGAAPYGLAAVR